MTTKRKSELPIPTGYRILLKAREISNKTSGGIILTDESKEAAKFSCVVSQVIDMGDECYKDMEKSSTKWCSIGPVSYTHLTLPTKAKV